MSDVKHFGRQTGLSLLEMLVVLIITSALLIMSYSILEDAARTSLFVEVRNDLPVQAQSAANAIQAEAFQASQIYDNDSAGIGAAYLGALQLPASLPLLTNSKLPVGNAQQYAELVPDGSPTATPPAPQYTGNCLLMVRQLAPIPVFTDAAHTQTLLADRYQFEFFYLTQRTKRGFSTSNYYLDLMRGRSLIFADFTQISLLTATQKGIVNGNLAVATDPNTGVATPITRAWSPGALLASAFYDLTTTAPYTTLVASPKIDMTSTSRSTLNSTLSIIPALSGGRVSGFANYSIAYRPSATAKFAIPDLVPKYAYFDSTKPAFPGGLEFLLIGAQGTRRLLTRVVLMADYSVNQLTSKEVINITGVR